MDSKQKQTLFTLQSDTGGTTGYAGVSATSDASEAAKVAGKYLKDPLLMRQLTERVYELLQQDMRSQRERVCNYNHQRW
ncbi:MAG: hypothetical protein KME21_24385 [Desmonostoc vinosum HA7617-LM4]|jgi:hypothetical protein|nr:hypothetical protein [Desmonostoc vinosum HA7617-LM4]